MKKYFIFTLVLFVYQSFAAERAGYEFLRSGYSARANGMAETFTAIYGDVNSIFYNPASIAGIEKNQATATYIDHLLDFQSGFVGYGYRLNNRSSIAVGAIYMNYGKFEETDIFGNKTGKNFGATDLAFSAIYAMQFEQIISYGVSAKFINSNIQNYSSSAYAFDFGLILQIPRQDMNLGLSIRNSGFVSKAFIKTKEKLPLAIEIGFSKKLEYLPLLLNGRIYDINEKSDKTIDIFKRFSIGGEFTINEPLRFRIGYDNQKRLDLATESGNLLTGFSVGFGFILKGLRIDYALSSFGALGNINRFSISGSF